MWWIAVVCFSNRHANSYYFTEKVLSIRIYLRLLVFEFPCHFFLPKGFWQLTNIVLSLTKIVILFSVFHPTRIFEIKSDVNRLCNSSVVIPYPVVYCIGWRIENFIGDSNEVWVCCGEAWELYNKVWGSQKIIIA